MNSGRMTNAKCKMQNGDRGFDISDLRFQISHFKFEIPLVALTLLLLSPVSLFAQGRKPPAAAPIAAPAAKTTAQLLAEAMEALRANDHAKAASLLDAARARPDFASFRPPVSLLLAAGDYQFAQGTKEGQDAALALYGLPAELYGENLPSPDRGMLRLRRAEVMLRQSRIEQAKEELALLRRTSQSRRALVYADLGDAQVLLLANQAEAGREKLMSLVEAEDPAIAAMAMFHLGRAYVQLKQTDQAIATFRKLWNRYGETDMVKRAIFLVGQIYFDSGDFLEARKLYEACSVVGAAMQTRVRPGDELIVKVYDSNYFTRTRSTVVNATLSTASGDRETLRLEKNPVSDQLYVGRIRTALAMPAANDGLLQFGGGDVIEISYGGQADKVHKIKVVDDGVINIDSVPLADPPARDQREMPKADGTTPPPRDVRPAVAAGKTSSGSLNPGSPVYVQIVDADLERLDTVTAEVVAQGGGRENVVTVRLSETGPRTGVFIGSVPTASSGPTITASSETPGHPATSAIDVDRNTPAPTTQPATRPTDAKAPTFWQAKMGDKSPYIEIDLHQQASLAKLVWGTGDDRLAAKNMPTDLTITLRGDGPEKVIALTNPSQSIDNVVDLKGVSARTIRIDISRFRGDAPAIGQLILTDTQGNQLLPAEIAPAGIDNTAVLEFNVGQNVFARYTDVDNETPGLPTVRQSRRLGARYHNGILSLVKPADLEAKGTNFRPAWRLDLGASPHVMLNDPDLDITPNPDTARVEVFSEAGSRQLLELTETGNSTGVFAAPLSLSTNPEAKDNPRILHIRPGDLVWFKYLDQQNMLPGYKTFRYLNLLENQPTAGDWQNLPAVTTAWPFEIAPADASEAPIAARPRGKGQLTLSIRDADAMANAATGVTVKINTLIGNVAQELMLACSAPGVASQQLDLMLGDTQPERRLGDPAKVARATELAVYGDDIIRVAYTDVRVPTADLQARAVADEAAGKMPGRAKVIAKADGEAIIPVINLANPHRRAIAAQEQRLAVLRRELNARLPAYAAERKLLEERREILAKRQAAAPTKAPTTAPADGAISEADALKETITTLSAQIDRLNGRIARLKALGASDVPNAPMPTTQPAAAALLTDGPLTPGQPFDLIIDDPDLPAATVEVRIRSVAGRLIQKTTVAAKRDASGKYTVRVPTKASDDAEDKDAVSLVPGGEVIVDYQNPRQAPAENVERVAYVALASDATLTVTNAGYFDSISKFRLGEPIYVQVVDFDADRSAAIDQVAVVVKSSNGDRELLMLSETEPHSGVFRGRIQTDNAQAKPNDDVLQANYGGTVEVTYFDYLRESQNQSLTQIARLHVSGGTDGTVEGFSRQFKDAQEEMKLWYRTGQSAYQIGRRLYLAGAYERADEYLVESTDYFSQLVARFPEDALAASSNYYLGNIQSLKGNHREALARFQEIVTRWPKSDFVARARFKIGQAFENLGRFDEAADAYVLLTYHHPDDAHVPMAMIRMMNYFARGEQFADAVSIAQKFVEKFPKHENAGPVALKAGQWLAVSSRPDEAVAWFVQTEKVFAASDKDMPALLYWHAATLIQMQQLGKAPRGIVVLRPEKIRELLQRVIYDYPRSEYANISRMALEQVVEPR